ncbi:MAG TPA: hypothetical protein VGK14_14305 [Novimethylophilus sp.]|uniref:hypothetical protein n=1 Tax=Novimethylophilus sp. TaxID=2137426 RepID=UPI002F42EF9F
MPTFVVPGMAISTPVTMAGLDPAMPELELTESIAMENQAFTIDMVDRCTRWA